MLPIIKRDGIKLIGENFIFQQDGAKSHTSGQSIEAIEKIVLFKFFNNFYRMKFVQIIGYHPLAI